MATLLLVLIVEPIQCKVARLILKRIISSKLLGNGGSIRILHIRSRADTEEVILGRLQMLVITLVREIIIVLLLIVVSCPLVDTPINGQQLWQGGYRLIIKPLEPNESALPVGVFQPNQTLQPLQMLIGLTQ
jgi:hypothetical protein